MVSKVTPPLRSLMALFSVKGAFAPSSLYATAAGLNCSGALALPGGAARRVVLAIEERTPASRGMHMTGRCSYGCGPARHADRSEAFYREIGGAVVPVLAAVARREARIAALWQPAARAWSADALALDLPESAMGGPVPADTVAAAGATRCRVIDVGIHLRSGCLQRCAFCRHEPQQFGPPAWDGDLETVRHLLRAVVRPAARRGIDLRFRVEADDLAGHGRLHEIVALLSRETAFGLHLVIPPNRLANPAVARLIVALPGLESVTLTLFGCTPRTHDAVAGRPGAFHELLRAARNIDAAGTVPISLSAVLTAGGARELGGMLDAAALLRSRLIISSLFADCPDHHPALKVIAPDLAALRDLFAGLERRILDSGARLQDFPACALPPLLRDRNDTNCVMQRNDYPALPLCTPCIHRPRCPGVPRGYLDAHGTTHLAPERPARPFKSR